jgi:hypothetical protein
MRAVTDLGLPANLRRTDKANLRLRPIAYSPVGNRFIPCEKSGVQPDTDWGCSMSAPPGNANARRQPGERVNRLTDKPKLRRRVRHVNGSYSEIELRTAKARRALREFAKTVTEARKVFAASGGVGSAGGVRAWLVFYDAKQAAYAKLVAALPQVAAIPDFWSYVQNMPATQWLPIIEAQIEQITRSRSLCEECGAVEVSWPTHRCPGCQEATRRETYRKSKQRTRIKQQMRKCPVCMVEPLNPCCRVCLSCQKASRRARNQRYQKSLKDDVRKTG